MGGNLFKETSRLSKQDYEIVVKDVLQLLKGVYKTPTEIFNDNCKPVIAYAEKESFGDLDILINSSIFSKYNLLSYLKSANIPFNDSGDVLSFRYEYNTNTFFQVDVIYTKGKYFLASYHYFSYNDLGNLLGRLTKTIGIKYGHKGLSLVVRDKEYVMGEIILSTDVNDMLDILGLDKETYNSGFSNLKEIFEFVISSKFFNADIFLLHNRNHEGRTRDKKRKTYHEFLVYLEEAKPVNKFIVPPKEYKGGYNLKEPFYTNIILAKFPWVEQEVERLNSLREKQKQFRDVFNPVTVIELTNLKGKELGAFFTWIRGNIDFRSMVSSGLEERQEYISAIYQQYLSHSFL